MSGKPKRRVLSIDGQPTEPVKPVSTEKNKSTKKKATPVSTYNEDVEEDVRYEIEGVVITETNTKINSGISHKQWGEEQDTPAPVVVEDMKTAEESPFIEAVVKPKVKEHVGWGNIGKMKEKTVSNTPILETEFPSMDLEQQAEYLKKKEIEKKLQQEKYNQQAAIATQNQEKEKPKRFGNSAGQGGFTDYKPDEIELKRLQLENKKNEELNASETKASLPEKLEGQTEKSSPTKSIQFSRTMMNAEIKPDSPDMIPAPVNAPNPTSFATIKRNAPTDDISKVHQPEISTMEKPSAVRVGLFSRDMMGVEKPSGVNAETHNATSVVSNNTTAQLSMIPSFRANNLQAQNQKAAEEPQPRKFYNSKKPEEQTLPKSTNEETVQVKESAPSKQNNTPTKALKKNSENSKTQITTPIVAPVPPKEPKEEIKKIKQGEQIKVKMAMKTWDD